MRISCFIHPRSSYLPCSGVGRHVNNMVRGLARHKDIDLQLLVSKQYVDREGKLNPRCPLRDLKTSTFPFPENITERMWKAFSYPKMNRWVEPAEWLYAPDNTYIPLTRVPSAITIHDIQAFETHLPWSQTLEHKLFRFKWDIWFRKMMREARVVLTVSEFSKSRMVELFNADPNKIKIVGNGVEESFFSIAEQDPGTLPGFWQEPYVFVIGGLRLKKGAEHVLEVAKALAARKSGLRIVVAGNSGPHFVEEGSKIGNIKFLGLVEDSDLPVIVRKASSVLFLSLYEGFGIPAAEAMAAGTPVLVSNRASLPEVVGNAGIIADPAEHEAIANILDELARDTALRERYSQAGKERAKEFTWGACVDRLVHALQERG